jgi:hypothetical protein
MVYWHPVDGQQRIQVVGEADDGRRVLPAMVLMNRSVAGRAAPGVGASRNA